MKRFIIALVATMMMIPSVSAYANEKIDVVVDGKTIVFDQNPVIENGRVLVPMRAIFEALDCNVDFYDRGNVKTVSARKGEKVVSLEIGKNKMLVYGDNSSKNIELDVPAVILNGRTMVPVRAISESLDAKVEWIDETKTVVIEGKKGQHNIKSEKMDVVIRGKDGTELVDFYYSYPVIENPDNDAFIDAINKTYKKDAEAFYEEIKGEYLTYAEDFHESLKGYAAEGNEINLNYPLMAFYLDYDVTINRNGILSITNNYYYDSAGAHPSTAKISRTFDIKEGKQLELKDILNGSDAEIERAIFKAYSSWFGKEFKNDKEYADMIKEEMKKEINNISYYVDDEGLVVYYQVYQVGPYAMGYPEARMNYKNNEHNFKIDLSGANMEKLEIVLPGNASTGYSWITKTQSKNIEVTKEFVSASTDPYIIGVGGDYIFTVKGLEKGNATFELEYKRPWADEVRRSVKYNLYVNDDGTLTIINHTDK